MMSFIGVTSTGIAGAVILSFLSPKRLAIPLILWLVGVGTFVLVGIAGLSVIDRYLLVPAMMTMLMAAVTLAGWTMLEEKSAPRRIWAAAAVVVVIFGVVFTATRVTVENFKIDLESRGEQHTELVSILDNPKVRAGLKCGPLSVPNHKLVPEVRWLLGGASVDEVIARSDDAREKDKQYGVALYVTTRAALLRQAIVNNDDDPADSRPLDGFTRIANSRDYGAFVRCRPGAGQ